MGRLPTVSLTTSEIGTLLGIAAGLDPDGYAKDTAKAAIYKARSLTDGTYMLHIVLEN